MLVDALQIGTLGLFSAMGGGVLYTDFRYQKIRNRVLALGHDIGWLLTPWNWVDPPAGSPDG